jgi:hypothetical protein
MGRRSGATAPPSKNRRRRQDSTQRRSAQDRNDHSQKKGNTMDKPAHLRLVRELTPTERAAAIDGAVTRLELARIGYETALEEIARVRLERDLNHEERVLADFTEKAAMSGLAKADAALALACAVA